MVVDAEMALHVGFGGRTAEDVGVAMDEGQIPALRLGEVLAVKWTSGA
jgi:hypothetical protein